MYQTEFIRHSWIIQHWPTKNVPNTQNPYKILAENTFRMKLKRHLCGQQNKSLYSGVYGKPKL